MIKKLTITFDYVVDFIEKIDKNGKKTTTRIYTKTWEIEDGTCQILKSNPTILQFKTADGTFIGYNLSNGINHYVIEDV